MGRNFRKNAGYIDSKVITFSVLGVLLLATIVFAILMYGKNIDDNVRSGQLSTEQIASINENTQETEKAEDIEKVSSSMGKSVEDSEKELQNQKEKSKDINEEKKDILNNTAQTNSNVSQNNAKIENAKTITKEKEVKKENKKELNFQKPVEGEITRNFAKDNLVYSETLSEWVTHNGIDIKADKTTVVKSAEEGIVKSIKNDPRYGLTIVVSHNDGFETLYANLLSSEFVKEGDKVTKGQALGTVGNTGVFESADEPHLHFEILKDSTPVDPNIYIK
ncbi:MAG: M23 family metallopeptidase [Clostridia bacterium]|nr:M23 family metallopeptidase [Clostridia bacterium]